MARDRNAGGMVGRWLALAAVGLGVTEPPGGRDPGTRTGGRSDAGEQGPASGTTAPGTGAPPVTDGPFIETKEAIGAGRR